MRFLDYHKVKDAERKKAKELFGTEDAPSDLATKVRHFPRLRRRTALASANCFPTLDPGTEVQGHRGAARERPRRHVEARPDKTHRRGEEEAAGDDQEGQ